MLVELFLKLLIIFAIIIFSLSVHELGHFIVGKLFKVNIVEYAIGVGPTIFYFYVKGIKFSLRFFLIGAFVLFDSHPLRQYASEILIKKNILQHDSQKLNWTRWYHFKWLHLLGNYNWKNIKEYFAIGNFIKYQRMLLPKKTGLFFFNEIKNYQKVFILFAGIFCNFILFLFFFGLSQINDTIGAGFVITDLKNVFAAIGESLFFVQSNLTIDLGNSYLHFFILTSLIFNLTIALFNAIPLPPLDMFKIFVVGYEKIIKKSLNPKVENIFAWIGLIIILYVVIIPIFSLLI